MKRKKHIAAAIIVDVALWFLCVDWSWFIHDCPDCGYSKDIGQYRLFTIPVHETTREFATITQRVAEDLGVPCTHKNVTIWHKHRWWGLVICGAPCANGVCHLTGDDSWYDQNASAKVAALGANDNAIKDDFVQNVLGKHDFDYVHTVLARAGVELEPPIECMSEPSTGAADSTGS